MNMPEDQYQALCRFFVPVELPLNMPLSEPYKPVEYLYFPISGLVSTDALAEGGESVEVGLTGWEGLAGLSGLLGHQQMPHMVIVQGAGMAIRVRTQPMRDEFLKGGRFAQLIYDYIYLNEIQSSQSVLCNRMHAVEARLARWLLTSADRSETEELMLTQEFLAQMLGARRSTVTVAAGELQRLGSIDYSRGRIRITNRPALEGRACECYRMVKAAYARVLSQPS